ncbi:hypothetical protein YA0002_02735 [Pseudomonas cichorii]|uniref:hypothetical protein n=1 Tax=Pseudomonas cichorii TaxID=36746 RepID=UPI0018E6318B|nr:hypothetical protein [Pseudomonas cichorii]MBI6851668.1 hypothetical protein [Pseudomonas cichorii]
MTDKITKYRVGQLERKVAGMQREIDVLHALRENDNKKRDREIRDLKINDAVNRGLPKKEAAKIYNLSAGRISQITSRSA